MSSLLVSLTATSYKLDCSLLNKLYHSRISHAKSRAGCDTCKQRRKKCDESRPNCRGCIDRAVTCYYAVRGEYLDAKHRVLIAPLSPVITNHGLPWSDPYDLLLLHHFHFHTSSSVGSSAVQEVVLKYLATAFELDYVKYVVLALSAVDVMFLTHSC